MFHGWDDQASFHFGLPSRSRLLPCGGLRVPRAAGREPQCTSASHVCVFLSLAAIPLARASHMLKPRICAGGDHLQVCSQGDMYKLGPFLQLSVTGLYMHACVCVRAHAVTIIDDIIKFSP